MLAEALQARGLQRVTIDTDGNCLFSAFALAISNDASLHGNFRALLCRHYLNRDWVINSLMTTWEKDDSAPGHAVIPLDMLICDLPQSIVPSGINAIELSLEEKLSFVAAYARELRSDGYWGSQTDAFMLGRLLHCNVEILVSRKEPYETIDCSNLSTETSSDLRWIRLLHLHTG